MGQLTLRLPDELHEALSASADDRGKSLNGLICELLARGMTEYGLRRSLVETVRQEMRAEFEARREPTPTGLRPDVEAFLRNAPKEPGSIVWLPEGMVI